MMLDLERVKARCGIAIGHFRWLMDVGALTREEVDPLEVLEADIPALIAENDRLRSAVTEEREAIITFCKAESDKHLDKILDVPRRIRDELGYRSDEANRLADAIRIRGNR